MDARTERRLSAYLDGELRGAERQRFEERLRREPELAATLELQRRLREELRATAAELPVGFAARARAALGRAREPASRAPWTRPWAWPAAGLTVSATLLAALLWPWGARVPDRDAPVGSAAEGLGFRAAVEKKEAGEPGGTVALERRPVLAPPPGERGDPNAETAPRGELAARPSLPVAQRGPSAALAERLDTSSATVEVPPGSPAVWRPPVDEMGTGGTERASGSGSGTPAEPPPAAVEEALRAVAHTRSAPEEPIQPIAPDRVVLRAERPSESVAVRLRPEPERQETAAPAGAAGNRPWDDELRTDALRAGDAAGRLLAPASPTSEPAAPPAPYPVLWVAGRGALQERRFPLYPVTVDAKVAAPAPAPAVPFVAAAGDPLFAPLAAALGMTPDELDQFTPVVMSRPDPDVTTGYPFAVRDAAEGGCELEYALADGLDTGRWWVLLLDAECRPVVTRRLD